jgi:hypothetical protein
MFYYIQGVMLSHDNIIWGTTTSIILNNWDKNRSAPPHTVQ